MQSFNIYHVNGLTTNFWGNNLYERTIKLFYISKMDGQYLFSCSLNDTCTRDKESSQRPKSDALIFLLLF